MRHFNPDIHHRRSIRLRGYDYSRKGLYFITICCQAGEWFFGDIITDVVRPSGRSTHRMILNDAGKIADQYWLQIPDHFPNVVLHAYVIMPNHIHGIIELKPDSGPTGRGHADRGNNIGIPDVGVPDVGVPDVGVPDVGVQNFEPLHDEPLHDEPLHGKQNEFQKIIPRSIGSIVRGYKTGVTKWFRKNTDIQKVWERNYYEHIIRDKKSYHAIKQYIIHNPMRWENDQFFDQ